MKRPFQIDLNPHLQRLIASGMTEAQAVAILEVLAELIRTTLATRAETSALNEGLASLAARLGIKPDY